MGWQTIQQIMLSDCVLQSKECPGWKQLTDKCVWWKVAEPVISVMLENCNMCIYIDRQTDR